MLVAYPIAFNTATLVGFIVYGVNPDLFWLKLTIAVNVAAVVMAIVAAVPGFIDWVHYQLLRLLPVLERSR